MEIGQTLFWCIDQEWRRRLRNVETTAELCDVLLDLESIVAVLADGLPKGAEDEALTNLIQDQNKGIQRTLKNTK